MEWKLVRHVAVVGLCGAGCVPEPVTTPPTVGSIDADAPRGHHQARGDTSASAGIGEAKRPPPRPLAQDEVAELAERCQPLVSAILGSHDRAAPLSDPVNLGIAKAALDALVDPPPLADVDVRRCAELLRRDLTARLDEHEARQRAAPRR